MRKIYNGGNTDWFRYVGIFLVLIAGIFLVWFLMKGKTTISGNWPEPETSQSITCEIDNFAYPFFAYDKSTKKNIKINIIFNNDNLYSIALINTLYYDTENAIASSEAINHASMGLSFADNDLDAESLGMSFSKLQDSLKMSLYAKKSEINNQSAKYFMLEKTSADGAYTFDEIKYLYENKGFNCKIINEES